MTWDIALLLVQDGLAMSAIYALLGTSLVLVFNVTRVLFMPQGDFMSYGAMTIAALGAGTVPGTVWLLVGLSAAVALVETGSAVRRREWLRLKRIWTVYGLLPVAIAAAVVVVAPREPPVSVQIALSVAVVAPLGPLIYRLAFRPVARASVLTLLFVSVALHFALVGAGLALFGPEVATVPPFFDRPFEVWGLTVPAQTLFVVAASLAVLAAFWLLFTHTLQGKALRAAAANPLGAELVGISPEAAGQLSFVIAALVGALSGILAAPITPIYYDTGFAVGLKGVVAATFGGMASYPLAAVGAVLVGLVEAFSSYWDSATREVIVFALILPVLVWRSLATVPVEGDDPDRGSSE